MENRVSRTSSSRSATASEIDDALYPAYHHYRPGPSLAASSSLRRPIPPSPARDNVHPQPENVFADPADSPPPSPTGSAFYSNSVVTPTPSVRRPSLSLSARRSPSPLPGANGGYYYSHHRLSQSLTPSIRSSSSSHGGGGGGGGGLNRSNTTGTNGTGYSTLSSIPSNLSDFTSPPSPLPPIAPVRPQWNYGGHQQNIYPDSVYNGSVVPEEDDDPFADDFMIPVGDGFAPHHHNHHQRGAAMGFPAAPSSVGSLEPPPYTRYPKPEEVGAPLMYHGDSGVDVGDVGVRAGVSLGEDRRNHGGFPQGTAGSAGLLAGADMMGHDGDASGASKEWRQKRVFGFRLPAAIAVALVVLLAVGVGLGVGLKASASSVGFYPNSTTGLPPPNSEESGPPLSSPNATFPSIPTGLALVAPLVLSDYSSLCGVTALDASAPSFFSGQGAELLWSCQFDQSRAIDALTWNFEKFPADGPVNMEDFLSIPSFLRGAEYGDGTWGAYMVSSMEGIRRWENGAPLTYVIDGKMVEYSSKGTWRDGAQSQPLWRMPFAFYNHTMSTPPQSAPIPLESSSWSNPPSARHANIPFNNYTYKFGALVNKTVIIKRTTITANTDSQSGTILTGNGTALVPGEIVWRCIWEKTLLEVELFVDDPSEGFARQGERASVENKTDLPRGSASSTGSPLPRGTGDASSAFFRAQPTMGTGSAGNLSATYKRNLQRRRPPAVAATGDDSKTDGPTHPYPHRMSIRESRPTAKRIRQILGMDLTDPDPDGHANLGQVKCTQYVVTGFGELSPFMDNASGEGYVVLKEQSGSNPSKRSTDGPQLRERLAYADRDETEILEALGEGAGKILKERGPAPSCFCQWNS